MKASLYIYLLLVLCTFQPCLSIERPRQTATPLKTSSRWDRYLNSVFQRADQNKDGSISLDEAYELVLLFYIKLNQQAPIPPPSKDKVKSLYDQADWSHNRRLNGEEFNALASRLAARGTTRLAAHKFVTVVVAPIVANYAVNLLSASKHFARVREEYTIFVQKYVPKKLTSTLISKEFWKTVLTILAVIQLGNLVLGVVNWWMDLKGPIIIDDEKEKAKEL